MKPRRRTCDGVNTPITMIALRDALKDVRAGPKPLRCWQASA
jgi:hypothetical protein